MNRVLEANVQRHHQPNKPTEEGQHNGGALLNQMENSPENAEPVEYDPVKEMIEQQWNSRKQQADQVIILFRSMYRRIAKTPRPLLYLEFEYKSRKIAKNILCYLVKLEYNSRKFD